MECFASPSGEDESAATDDQLALDVPGSELVECDDLRLRASWLMDRLAAAPELGGHPMVVWAKEELGILTVSLAFAHRGIPGGLHSRLSRKVDDLADGMRRAGVVFPATRAGRVLSVDY